MEEGRQGDIRSHNIVLVILTITSIGAMAESLFRGWEMWVPPLIGAGIIAAWWMHIIQYGEASMRENYYLIFAMLVSFYHGVHRTSLFDNMVISAMLMGTMVLLRKKRFLRLLLAEYFLLLAIQLGMAAYYGEDLSDSVTVSRIGLHVVAIAILYTALSASLEKGVSDDEEIDRLKREKSIYDHDMEDFLVNISHELRTPVNVINGLSDLILRKEKRDDVRSIRNAGLRLSHQIECIQDYSEIQRRDVKLEKDRYSVIALVNDVLTDYGLATRNQKLEFLVDLDPTVPAVLKGDFGKLHKIIKHLLNNAFKFTRSGGTCLRISALKKDYGINLIIEVTDTGIGMSQKSIESVSRGIYQANTKRNRSTGGIGLGLSIVYGLVRSMDGFVKIESERNKGTTVRVSVFQEVIDPSPCLSVTTDRFINGVLYIRPEKFSNARLGELYRNLAKNLAAGLRVNLYFAIDMDDITRLIARGDITHVFTGVEEYMEAPGYFDDLSEYDIVVAVSAGRDFAVSDGSGVIVMPKPLYVYPVVQILNGKTGRAVGVQNEEKRKPEYNGVKALVVDDEPMNLVVAKGLFEEYKMMIETAESGMEAISRFEKDSYDVIFMDHMMPEMDGVEAMKRIKRIAELEGRDVRIIALTANAVSGAKEMFLREGFDGFIPKPIKISKFESVMDRVLSDSSGGMR
ncbi:MAG: response regulator [Butyrivibrio sp.]|nr:response regulator [Butyrivibrio sp.]